jgi:chromate transporter
MESYLSLFWVFLKVNLLSTSGIASVGLLHQEAVGRFVTEDQFVQAVAFASVLPGSDALQLAMFIGYTVDSMKGALVALLGSILPPTVLMLVLVSILHRLRREAWVGRFVEGLAPAVTVLMIFVAFKLFNGKDGITLIKIALGAISFAAFWFFDITPPIVLILAGLAGIFLFQ